MRSRFATALVLALAGFAGEPRVAGATTDGPEAVWTELDITDHLNDAGVVHVVEMHQIEMRPGVGELARDFGLGAGQRVVLSGLWRLTENGAPVALSPGDVSGPDQYAIYPTWLRWTPPATAGDATVSRRYRLEYDLVNAVLPAWDVPNGDRALDGLHASYRRPDERAADLARVWREAWPQPHRRYRIDHDILLPGRGDARYGLGELRYRLEYDEAWLLLDENRDLAVATPRVDYRVRRTLEYVPPGRPSRVDVTLPSLRIAGILGLPVVGALLWAGAFAVRRALDRSLGPADNALFRAAVLSEPPEIAGQRLTGNQRPPDIESFLVRLASERRLAIEVPARHTDGETLQTRLRLLCDRETLHPYEREVIDALFGPAREVTPADLSKRCTTFDSDDVIETAFRQASPPRPPSARFGQVLGATFFFSGVAAAFASLQYEHSDLPYALFAGVSSGFVLVGVPLGLIVRIVIGFVLQLLPNAPLHPLGCAGLSLLLLAGYAARLAGVSRRTEVGRKYLDLARAHDWAIDELKKPQPDLRDAWIPHLDRIGLSQAVAAWKARYGTGGGAAISAPFTGQRPPLPFPDDDEWAAGFSF